MIEGVRIEPLRQIRDDRGAIFHMLRADDPAFEAFGEIYFSFIHPGWVKAWHLHPRMVLNYVVPVGRIRLVLYDDRDGSRTRGELQEIALGEDPALYRRVRIPAGVWNGHACVGDTDALVANCATLPHDPSEGVRIAPDDARIPYRWSEGTVRGW